MVWNVQVLCPDESDAMSLHSNTRVLVGKAELKLAALPLASRVSTVLAPRGAPFASVA